MENIRKKINLIMKLLKFISNKKNTEFVAKLCPKFNYIGPKKNLRWSHIFFKVKKT